MLRSHRAAVRAVSSSPLPSAARSTSLRGGRPAPLRSARSIIKGFVLMVSIVASHAFAQDSGPAPADGVYDMLVGTYTGGKSEGIYVYRFDTKTGEATRVSVAQTVNPSYLVVSRDRRFVYAVNELPGDNGPATQRGGISAFRFDAASGQLTFVNEVSSDGNDPAYLAISPDGRQLFGRVQPGRQFCRVPAG